MDPSDIAAGVEDDSEFLLGRAKIDGDYIVSSWEWVSSVSRDFGGGAGAGAGAGDGAVAAVLVDEIYTGLVLCENLIVS